MLNVAQHSQLTGPADYQIWLSLSWRSALAQSELMLSFGPGPSSCQLWPSVIISSALAQSQHQTQPKLIIRWAWANAEHPE